MPWHLSAKKRLRSDKTKTLRNKSRISSLRTAVKKARQDLGSQDLLKAAQSALAVAASKGVIHRNAAARKTSRLMKQANKS